MSRHNIHAGPTTLPRPQEKESKGLAPPDYHAWVFEGAGGVLAAQASLQVEGTQLISD
jgi:hypothetical protein